MHSLEKLDQTDDSYRVCLEEETHLLRDQWNFGLCLRLGDCPYQDKSVGMYEHLGGYKFYACTFHSKVKTESRNENS